MPSPQKPISIALVGCGAVSQQFYAPSLAYLENQGLLNLRALIDPNEATREKLAVKFPQATQAADLQEIASDEFDLAIIASPPKFHCPQTLQAFENGCHVLCEKPMAYSSQEADSMISAANSAGKLLAIGHYKRFFPAADEIKSIIEHQTFGDLVQFDIQEGGKFAWPAASDSFFRNEITPGGILLDIGVHVLDLIIWWLGQPQSFDYCDDNLGGLESNAKLHLDFESGAKGKVFLTREWKTPMAYTFHFEKAAVVYKVNDSNGLSIRLHGSHNHLSGTLKDYRAFGPQELPQSPKESNSASFIRQLENVCLAIRDGIELKTDGLSGKAPLELIEQCYRHRRLIEQPWLSPEENESLSSPQALNPQQTTPTNI